MNNTTTLTEAVKAIHTVTPTMSVKEIRDIIAVNYTHLQADYRKVYNTLKRIWVGSASKPSKSSKVQKTSIVFDLTQTPVNAKAIPGKVVCAGRR
jgi:hypothetical protein